PVERIDDLAETLPRSQRLDGQAPFGDGQRVARPAPVEVEFPEQGVAPANGAPLSTSAQKGIGGMDSIVDAHSVELAHVDDLLERRLAQAVESGAQSLELFLVAEGGCHAPAIVILEIGRRIESQIAGREAAKDTVVALTGGQVEDMPHRREELLLQIERA